MSIDWNKVKNNAKLKDDAQYAAMSQDMQTIRAAGQPPAATQQETAPTVTQQEDEGFDLGKFLLGTLGKGANAIAKAGSSTLAFTERAILEPLFPGITQSTPIQDLNKGVDKDAAALQEYTAENLEKGGKAARIAENVGVGVIAAVPQAVVAIETGGASLGAQGLSSAAQASPTIVNTLKTGISKMVKNPSYWTSFLTTVGNNYESAKKGGADDTRASLYALADSLIGSAVEVAGGIQTLPAELQGGRFTARKWIDAMLDEGKEEVVQGVLSRGLENVVYNKGNAIASVTDKNAILNPLTSAEEFGMGAAVGGILGGAQGILANTAQNPAGKAAGAQTVSSEGKFTPAKQTSAQGLSDDIMTAEAQRLFGKNKTAPEAGAGNARMTNKTPVDTSQNPTASGGNESGYKPASSGTTVTQPGDSVSVENLDPLLKLMLSVKEGTEEDGIPIDSAEGRRAYPNINKVLGDAAVDKGTGKDNAKGFDPLMEAARNFATKKQDIDPLLKLMLGGKRVAQNKASNEQFAALADRGDIGVDAAGKMFQIDSAQHIDRRSMESVGSRKVNAFQFDHPQLHSYFQRAANALIADADLSLQFGVTRSYERGMQGNKVNQKVQTSQHLRRAMDETGLSRNEIIDAAQRIVNDKGQENVKAAKQVEIILDDMLTYGWKPMMGEDVAPNEAYIAAKNEIAGSQPDVESGHGLDGVGAANLGFDLPGKPGTQKTSRIAESFPYDRMQAEATGLSKEDYAKIFRYQSQTESRSLGLAENLLYVIQGGRKTFLMDVDADAYKSVTDSLRDAPAWNGPMMDAARMIQQELQGRSVNGEITSEEYVEWLETMREHETATGQGVQANAKWSRKDNGNGQATELDAWKALEQSNLSEDRKRETFQKIVQWDTSIEGVAHGDTAAMKDIIMQVARERGVVNGVFGKAFTRVAESSLDSLTFDQLKQFAYSSTSALASDSTGADWGQKLKTVQVLNMLSSPKTAVRNLVGNTTFYGIDALAMDGAALLDMAVAKLTGTRSIAMEPSSLADAAKAMQMSIAEITLDVDMGGEKNRYETGSNRTFKVNGRGAFNSGLAADRLLERTLSAIERNQAYLLTATDEFYKGAARGTQRSTQKLVDSGKIKTEDRDYAAKQADRLAKYRTFQDDSKLSVAIQQIHDVLNLVGVGDSGKTIKGKTVHAFGAGDIAAPFTRVASNIVSRGVEYSPINAVRGAIEIAQQVVKAAGGQSVDPVAQAKGVSGLARGMTGTAIAYGFMLLAKEGLLRQANDEDDPNVAAMNQSEGIAGTQINISAVERALVGGGTEWRTGDTLVDLSSIEPLNFLVNLGAELAKEDSNPLVSVFNATTSSAMSAATELPILESARDFAEDVFKYGADPKESLAREAADTLISSVVPNVVAGVAKGLDDRPRNTYAGDDLWSIIQASFKNRIPGLRETLPGSVNSMGEEKLYTGSEDALLAALLSPVKINTYAQSDISKEMARVREATGDASFYPAKSIPKELSYTDENGKKHIASLDYEQRQDFQRDRNTLAIITGTNIMASSAYKNATATKQAELLDDANTYAYEVAKANVMGRDSASAWVSKTIDATGATGLNPATVIIYRDKLSTEKQKGQTTAQANKAIRNAIMADSSLTTAQKSALDNIVISDGVYIPKDVEVDYSNAETFTISQMSEGAQKRWSGIKNQFGMDASTYNQVWSIYQNDDLTAAQKRQQLSSLGYNGSTLYSALGKKLG